VDTPAERERVTCVLRDGKGKTRPLVQRLQAKGDMELICPELQMMAARQGLLAQPAGPLLKNEL
jgi:hypothetical protein